MGKLKPQAEDVADVVRSYAGKIARVKAKLDGPKGELGNLYSQLDDVGIHRQAFKLALKLKNLEPTACDEYLRCLDLYAEALGLKDQQDMFEQGARQAEEVAASQGEAADYSSTLAFEQGCKAGASGKPATDNPYDAESQGAGNAAWNSGWLREQQKLAGDMAETNGHGKAKKKSGAQRRREKKAREQHADA